LFSQIYRLASIHAGIDEFPQGHGSIKVMGAILVTAFMQVALLCSSGISWIVGSGDPSICLFRCSLDVGSLNWTCGKLKCLLVLTCSIHMSESLIFAKISSPGMRKMGGIS
jgi:hypothetical protein